jgi:PAS domain S-box-containing protein
MTLTAGTDHRPSGSHRFELLIDAISDYAIYMLDPEGFITTWNKGAEKIKKYTADEIIGRHFSRFFTAQDQANRVPETLMTIARTPGALRGRRLERAQGWQPLLVQCDPPANRRRERRSDRFRQNHTRYHRAEES